MREPRLLLSVKRELWDDMALNVSPEFADSYLSGAVQRTASLIPHTVTAYQRLNQNSSAKRCLQRWSLKLVEPLPFGHPERPDSQRMAAE